MLQVNRLGPEIGAEVLGADIRNLDAETFDVIYRTWLDCNVIAVRDQSLELEDFSPTAAASATCTPIRRKVRAIPITRN